MLFRAVLLLQGFDPPVTKPEIVRMTAQKLGIDSAPFAAIFALRESNGRDSNETEAHDLFAAYLEQIERVIEFVDKINNES